MRRKFLQSLFELTIASLIGAAFGAGLAWAF